jgi:hypothetical protein
MLILIRVVRILRINDKDIMGIKKYHRYRPKLFTLLP